MRTPRGRKRTSVSVRVRACMRACVRVYMREADRASERANDDVSVGKTKVGG